MRRHPFVLSNLLVIILAKTISYLLLGNCHAEYLDDYNKQPEKATKKIIKQGNKL